METTDLAPTFKQLGQTLRDALGALSIDIVKAQSKETATALQAFRDSLAQFALEADKLSAQWDGIVGTRPRRKRRGSDTTVTCPPDKLHLGNRIGGDGNQTKQMLGLIQSVGAAKVYGICKRHNIVANGTTTHLFVDKEPYTIAQPAKSVTGEDGGTYYVYFCLSVGQKQQRLDEVAKWL